ncbi:hypothetical protein GCM10010349_71310 [Streptomyces flavofungini]|nr:hypothetical protein GCM10010349_71310 [Streptomyces flavofungini]
MCPLAAHCLPSGLSPSVQEFHLVNRPLEAAGSRTVTAGSELHRPRSALLLVPDQCATPGQGRAGEILWAGSQAPGRARPPRRPLFPALTAPFHCASHPPSHHDPPGRNPEEDWSVPIDALV